MCDVCGESLLDAATIFDYDDEKMPITMFHFSFRKCRGRTLPWVVADAAEMMMPKYDVMMPITSFFVDADAKYYADWCRLFRRHWLSMMYYDAVRIISLSFSKWCRKWLLIRRCRWVDDRCKIDYFEHFQISWGFRCEGFDEGGACIDVIDEVVVDISYFAKYFFDYFFHFKDDVAFLLLSMGYPISM